MTLAKLSVATLAAHAVGHPEVVIVALDTAAMRDWCQRALKQWVLAHR